MLSADVAANTHLVGTGSNQYFAGKEIRSYQESWQPLPKTLFYNYDNPGSPISSGWGVSEITTSAQSFVFDNPGGPADYGGGPASVGFTSADFTFTVVDAPEQIGRAHV